MFALYQNRKKRQLLIYRNSKLPVSWKVAKSDIPLYYNDFYYICANRENLVKKGLEIRKQWESEDNLNV